MCIDLITIQNGTKISPIKIEDVIKSEVPFLSNVMVVGENRSYLTCLVTLKVSNAILEKDESVFLCIVYY